MPSKTRPTSTIIHATILHLLGLDHEQLTWMHNGRAERLTGVAGRVIEDILA